MSLSVGTLAGKVFHVQTSKIVNIKYRCFIVNQYKDYNLGKLLACS